MNLQWLSWFFALGVSLTVGGGVIFGLSRVADLLLSFSSHQRALRFYRRLRPKEEQEMDLDRVLLGGVNWLLLATACSFVAFWAVALPTSVMSYGLVAAVASGGLVWFVRSLERERKLWQVKMEIRDFLSGLRLALSIRPTISLALETASRQMAKGLFADRLRLHVSTRLLTEGAEAVLARLGREFRSPELERLIRHVEAATRGGLPLPEALRRASREMEKEMLLEAEYAVEEAPVRLTFPMLISLFPPVILLTVIPLLSSVIEQLGSMP
ncbi:MAG: type II secretion system F family protein [Chloroflexi bacterium]|nr:type II secretion system F family protein [Chloroflexota bacterium]